MAKYYENIVIGKPLCSVIGLISNETVNDYNEEIEKTYFTEERSIPNILKDIGVVKSASEVRRNKPELCKRSVTHYPDCFWIKWGKRRFYVIVGPEEDYYGIS